MNKLMLTSLWHAEFISRDNAPTVEFLDNIVVMFLSFQGSYILFLLNSCIIYIPSSNMELFFFPVSSLKFILFISTLKCISKCLNFWFTFILWLVIWSMFLHLLVVCTFQYKINKSFTLKIGYLQGIIFISWRVKVFVSFLMHGL